MNNINKSLEVVEASFDIPLNRLERYNITLSGKRTSVTLEPKTWQTLKSISEYEKMDTNDLCSLIASRRGESTNMSSAIRVFLISYLASQFENIIKRS